MEREGEARIPGLGDSDGEECSDSDRVAGMERDGATDWTKSLGARSSWVRVTQMEI
jgi:hypothetical protein